MASETTTHFISFPKQELIDYLELDHDTGFTPGEMYILSDDNELKVISVRQDADTSEETGSTNQYEVSYLELLDNILLAYDPDLQVPDILKVTDSSDFSKITVEY
jgi:hypothetical protein